jgi:hypothetical protein
MHKDAAHARISGLLTGLIEFRQVPVLVKDQVDGNFLVFVCLNLSLE